MKTPPVALVLSVVAGWIGGGTPADAAFISYFGGTISENFDGMGPQGTATTPLAGWYAAAIGARTYFPGDPNNALPADGRFGAFATAYVPPPDADRLTSFSDGSVASDGNANGGIYNYGATDAADRALGLIASGSIIVTNLHPEMMSQAAALEVAMINDSGADLIGFNMTFTEEQWHSAQGPGSQPVVAFYSIDGGGVWTELPFEFSLVELDSTYTNTGIDGNLTTMARGGTFMFPPGELIGNGGEFYVRWVDYNDAGITDMGAAIDNWQFTGIIPEPGVALLGLPSLVLMLRRRRR